MNAVSKTTITFDRESIWDLEGEALRVYVWMVIYLPAHGYEMSYREIAVDIGMSPTTVRKAINIMVDKGYVERTVTTGLTATYKILR